MPFLILSFSFLIPPPAVAGEALFDRVVASVNGKVLTLNDARYEAWAISGWGVDPGRASPAALAEALDELIDRALLVEAAKAMRIRADNGAIERATAEAVGDIRRRFEDEAALLERLRGAGVSFETLRDMIRHLESDRHMARRALYRRVNVSEQEIKAFEAERRARGEETVFYRLDQILIALSTGAPKTDEADARRRAVQIATRLGRGESFADLAALMSDDAATADARGQLGWVARRDLRRELREAVETMEVGRFSAPLRTPSGYHILWLRGKRNARALLLGEKLEAERRQWLEQLRRQADIAFFPYERPTPVAQDSVDAK